MKDIETIEVKLQDGSPVVLARCLKCGFFCELPHSCIVLTGYQPKPTQEAEGVNPPTGGSSVVNLVTALQSQLDRFKSEYDPKHNSDCECYSCRRFRRCFYGKSLASIV